MCVMWLYELYKTAFVSSLILSFLDFLFCLCFSPGYEGTKARGECWLAKDFKNNALSYVHKAEILLLLMFFIIQ